MAGVPSPMFFLWGYYPNKTQSKVTETSLSDVTGKDDKGPGYDSCAYVLIIGDQC